MHNLRRLQATAGNAATSWLLNLQRCGDIPPEKCGCHDDDRTEHPLQRTFQGTVLQREVVTRFVRCRANTDDAPADPVAALRAADNRAREFAQQLATAFAADAASARSGIPVATPTFTAYQNNFGLPGRFGAGFLNRLTGKPRRTQEIAVSEELAILSRRYQMVARLFSQPINYICLGTGRRSITFAGETFTAAECANADAETAPPLGVIIICQTFWAGNNEQRASILLHEGMHIVLESVLDATTGGPGRCFNIAGCYEQVSADIFGFDSVATCPGPP